MLVQNFVLQGVVVFCVCVVVSFFSLFFFFSPPKTIAAVPAVLGEEE